jgi:lipopolysaccharide transport system ATP-binding protein
MSTIIKVEDLSKQYRLGQVGTGTLSHDINRWYHKVRGKEDPYFKLSETNDRVSKGKSDYVWALKDVNFDIKQGEVVGIIGRNGAGKSTLLKILSRTTVPTKGCVKIKGRIASLLEVGTGFHPELSGRENIFLNGAILGMTKAEIRKNLDEIIDFAGVERYIDTPVKRYSSGMYVRLAFAVAAHLEPEILIVDEVLAVGDVEFQKKALGKMHDVSNKDGRTVLFVSHNLASLASLCTRGLLMQNGMLQMDGPIRSTIYEYEKQYTENLGSEWRNTEDIANPIYLESIKILDEERVQRNLFLSSEEVLVKMEIVVKEQTDYVKLGFDLYRNNDIAFRSQQVDTSETHSFNEGKYSFTCTIPKNLLNEGEYRLKPQFSIHCVKNLLTESQPVVGFNIKIDSKISDFHSILNESNHPGIVYPALDWQVKKIRESDLSYSGS